MRPSSAGDLRSWKKQLAVQVKSFFHLAQATAVDLKNSAKVGVSWLVAAAPSADAAESFDFHYAGSRGLGGFLKTVALEWPAVRCKFLNFASRDPTSSIAKHLIEEMMSSGTDIQVTYKGDQRFVTRTVSTAIKASGGSSLAVGSNCVIVLTGGTRGITAQIAVELALRYHPTLVLIGRSRLPDEEDAGEMATLAAPQEIKAALAEGLRRSGKPVNPAGVEAAYMRLLQEREIRRNLETLRGFGSVVQYHQADVRDEIALGAALEETYRQFGRIDGVVHGAGTVEDKLVEDKTPDSFDRVFDTKVDSAYILTRKLDANSLKFLVFFSSVSGVYGNRGQADYAAANEILNGIATCCDRRWPGRVVAINWGPWGQVGMVSAGIERQFRERGIQVIHPTSGRHSFDQELRYGKKGDSEIVLGEGPWRSEESVNIRPSGAYRSIDVCERFTA